MTELLDREGDPDQAAREIARFLALRDEARAALPALQSLAQRKAGEDGVRKVISRRFATFPQPDRSEEEWAAWWADYIEALSDLPLASLEAGIRAYVASSGAEFMPKPGKLRDLAETSPSQTLRRYQRVRRALMFADGQGAAVDDVPKRPSEAEAAAIRKMAAETAAKLKANAKPIGGRVERVSTAGKPDETGITEEMRKAIARREASA